MTSDLDASRATGYRRPEHNILLRPQTLTPHSAEPADLAMRPYGAVFAARAMLIGTWDGLRLARETATKIPKNELVTNHSSRD